MSPGAVRVIATARARRETRETVAELLRSLVEPTLKERGCIEYALHVDTLDDLQFVFVEEWESEAALNVHLKASHVAPVLAALPALLDGDPVIRLYSKIAGGTPGV